MSEVGNDMGKALEPEKDKKKKWVSTVFLNKLFSLLKIWILKLIFSQNNFFRF